MPPRKSSRNPSNKSSTDILSSPSHDVALDDDELIDRLLDQATESLKEKSSSGPIVEPVKSLLRPTVRLGEDLQVDTTTKIPIPSLEAKSEEKTDPSKWFEIPAPKITPEIRRELQLLKMRSVLDPKRHYKRDTKELPKNFQIGTVIAGAQDYYSSRITNKQKNKSNVEQLLRDQERRQYFKEKYSAIQTKKQEGKKKHVKSIKNKRKKAHERE